MKWVAIIFSALMMITAIGSGNMPQINNIANVMESAFTVPKRNRAGFSALLAYNHRWY